MSAIMNKNLFRTAGATTEQLVFAGPCMVFGIRPELTTTGTITLRDASATGGSNVKHVCAIGLLQAGKDMDGVVFKSGLTVQLSVATDLSMISWLPYQG